MDLEQIFSLANMVALIGWICLALAPILRGIQTVIVTLIILLLSLAYVGILWPGIIQSGGMEGSFSSLAGVKDLFSQESALLVGWLHYLAFDLFVGAWQVRDAQSRGVPHWLVLPCLVLTFMFGPTGLLLYFIIRMLRLRQLDTVV